jgi:hypothetical protein
LLVFCVEELRAAAGPDLAGDRLERDVGLLVRPSRRLVVLLGVDQLAAVADLPAGDERAAALVDAELPAVLALLALRAGGLVAPALHEREVVDAEAPDLGRGGGGVLPGHRDDLVDEVAGLADADLEPGEGSARDRGGGPARWARQRTPRAWQPALRR